MGKNHRSEPRLVHAALDVKAWLAHPPSVAAVRPGQCPRCRAPSRPVGRGLGLWGHGRRGRQVRGPLTAEGPPVLVEIVARRYRCRACGAIVFVVPHGLVAHRLFSAGAIALAFARYGIERLSLPRVRAAVNPWRRIGATAAAGWLAVRRWVRAVRAQRLFPGMRLGLADRTARAVAARTAYTLAALSPIAVAAVPMAAAVFAGASAVA
jgi:hypothetical protein